MLERRWKLPASSRYSFLGKQKGLISEGTKPFIMRRGGDKRDRTAERLNAIYEQKIAAETGWPPLRLLYPYVSLDHLGQLDRQLAEIGDIQKGIPVDPFDAGLVVADGGGHEQNVLALILLLDAP